MAASNGTIKRLVSDKGFGFILADDGNEYFFHNSACQGTRFDQLREGQPVTFDKGQGPKGPRGCGTAHRCPPHTAYFGPERAMVAAPASPRAVVRISGDAAWADYLRRMLAVATQ